MSVVIEVVFDPTKWTSGSGAGTSPGDNGYDAWSVFLDNDGMTAWVFETFPNGFARINLSDGSIVVQDAIFGDYTGAATLAQRTQATHMTFWAQDSAHYYTARQAIGHSYPTILYKFHIASGPPGNLLNGYCVEDGTLDVSLLTPQIINAEDMIAFSSGGVNYIAFVSPDDGSNATAWVINTDTMAFVGSYSQIYSVGGFYKAFVDKNHDVWFAANTNSGAQNVFVRWHPPDGVTGTTLNVTTNIVPDSTTGFSGAENYCYVSANHSVFIGGGNVFPSETGYGATIDLVTLNRIAFHTNDGMFWYEKDDETVNESAMDLGVAPTGLLMIPGSLNPATGQKGGVINIVDPTNLTLQNGTGTAVVTFGSASDGSPLYIIKGLSGASSYNITSIVNAAGGTQVKIVGGRYVSLMGVGFAPPSGLCGVAKPGGNPNIG